MNWSEPRVFAVKHKESQVREKSRSGGIFTALSDQILDAKGAVYGCILNEEMVVQHVRATTKEMRDSMRGSKYVQSDLTGIFPSVKKDLEDGLQVMFTGTSCQVMGLQNYLGKEYPGLFCVDIVCHGVPSPKVWEKYIQWQQQKNRKAIETVDFRNKKAFGWAAHVETLYFMNGSKKNSRVFSILFGKDVTLRPSCYECPFKSTMHPSDITIADYWGIDGAVAGFNDNKGVSLVLVNNDQGMERFHAVEGDLIVQETKLKDSLQPALQEATAKPAGREEFWRDFNEQSFETIAKKYGEYNLKTSMKMIIKQMLYKVKK